MIERVKGSNKPCPCCNKGGFNDFPNLGLQQPLYGFKVYCVNKEKGCEWKGELGKLDDHLNLNPQDRDDKELEGCEFAEVECSYCSDFIKRNKLLHHKNELCDKRPVVECDFHYAGCEVRLPRRNMPDHLKDGLVAHLSLLAVSHKRQQEEMKVMRGEIDELKSKQNNCDRIDRYFP